MMNAIDRNGIDKDTFENMIEDWKIDNEYGAGSEYDDMTIDLSAARIDDETGKWSAPADDEKGIAYTVTYNADHDIIIIA